MSEFDEIIMKLLKQQKILILVIAEAEKKKDEFLEAIIKGKSELEKLEFILEKLR